MKNLILCLLYLVSLSIGISYACNEVSEEDLTVNKQIWESHRWNEYRFIVQRQCFCYVNYTREMMVHVSEGKVVTAKYTDTQVEVSADILSGIYTIDKWFEVIDHAYSRQADKLQVQFDQQVGYPLKIEIDLRENRADDEEVVLISSIEKL